MRKFLTEDQLDRPSKPTETAVSETNDDHSTEDTSSSSSSTSHNSEREALKEAAGKLGPDQELVTDSFYFNVASSFVSFMNLICLGLEVDLRCPTAMCSNPTEYWDFITQGFTAFFVLEMILRIVVATPRRFFKGDMSRDIFKFDFLNCIDFMLVFLRVVDSWMLYPFGVVSNLKFASAFRVFQFGRAVRQVQLHPNFRELWIVISAVGDTMWTLVWVGIMLVGVIYVCGILVSMAVLDKGAEDFNLNRAEWDFNEYWGTVLRSSFSLFQVVTRDKWSDALVWPLVESNPELMVVFIAFFTIASLSLMNSIVGVVVESTLASARANADREQKERERVDHMVLESMKQIFEDADTDKSGRLDQEELKSSFCDGRVRDRLRLLRIPFKDLEMLFGILDDEQAGQVNTNKFFRGVQRLRGQAAACHLQQMNVDLGRRLVWCDQHQQETALCRVVCWFRHLGGRRGRSCGFQAVPGQGGLEMGAGAGAAKKAKYSTGPEIDDQPGFDHDAWRTPKIRGQAQPLSERRDATPSWSPRQGGKPVTIKIDKPKTAPSESRPVTRPLGSPTATASPGLLESLTSEVNGTRPQTLGSKAAVEYIPALGDEPELKKAGSTTSLGEALDPAVLLEEMELMWKKLLAKRQGASANMGALFKARQLKDEVDEVAKQTTDTQQKKALAASKVAGRIHLIEDACHTLEKKAVKNIGKGALWRRGDLAVRAGGNGLCEITATNMKSEMDVHMCITGANLTLDRGMLVPMTRKEMEDLRKLLSEMEAAKAEQTRLQEAVTQSCDQLRQKHEKLVEQIELELEELEKDPEFAPAGTQPQNMELVIGWNGQQHRPSQSEAPSFPQMAGLISAAEMMLKAQAEQKAAEKATKPRTNEASDWVEETNEEGETIFRNQKTGETATELPESAKEAAAPMGHAASPTVPAGAIPPWAKAPPKPQGGLWREPGLAMPKSKAPPPMPKAPAALERLQKLKEDAAASLQETQGLSKSLGPRAKVPGPPAPGSSLGPAAAAAAKAAATAKAAAAAAAAAGPAAEATTETPAAAEQPASEAAKEAMAPTTYWTEVQTEEGDTYYHNEATDETAWELPPGGVIKKPDDNPAATDAEQPAEYDTPAPVPEALKCPLCEDYLDEAVLAVCCGSNFCHRCVTAAMAEAPRPNTCPKCQTEVHQLVPNEDLRRRVREALPVSYWSPVTADDGQTYYYNLETGEAAWELPRGGQVYSDQGQVEAPADGQMFGAWMQCQTPEGQVYYYNQQTGETSWDLPAQAQAQQAQQAYNPFAQAEEAARLQRQQYEDALRSMQQAEEQARQQREQWDQIYAQHFAWYQQQQQQQAQAAAAAAQGAERGANAAEGAAAGLVPPSIHATMEEQIAFAMKCSVVQEMEEMMNNGASVADRKKALKAWQIKWHPDKNPDQVEVAKTLFQFLAEKRQWFCQDPSAEGNWEDIPVDAVD